MPSSTQRVYAKSTSQTLLGPRKGRKTLNIENVMPAGNYTPEQGQDLLISFGQPATREHFAVRLAPREKWASPGGWASNEIIEVCWDCGPPGREIQPKPDAFSIGIETY